jgi:MinD-like ATPase involved in chromosome partitioning or flagellar assembly
VLITLISAKGSPGVTASTLALASCWPRSAVVVDVDPQSGDVLVGLDGGRRPSGPGIVDVLVEARHGDLLDALGRHVTRPVSHGPPVIAGFGAPGQATTVPWAPLARILTGLSGTDVLADCGRFCHGHPQAALLHESSLTIVVTGSSLRALRTTARVLPQLRDAAGVAVDDDEGIGLIVVGPDQPYSVQEIEGSCEAEVIGVLPHDADAARVWTDAAHPRRSFRRSALQRAASGLAQQIVARLATELPSGDPSAPAREAVAR